MCTNLFGTIRKFSENLKQSQIYTVNHYIDSNEVDEMKIVNFKAVESKLPNDCVLL